MLGSSSTYNSHINHSGQDSVSKFFWGAPIFRSGLKARSNKNININPISTKCRQSTNADCSLQTGYKMQTENFYCFFVRHVITCHLTTYRNRFSAIIFHDYLHYCRIFLVRFLITIVFNIISSLHIVFSLCARVGWCDVCTELDVDVNEMSLLNI